MAPYLQIWISETINCERYYKIICVKNPEILQEIENNIFRETVSDLRHELHFMSTNIFNMSDGCSKLEVGISRLFYKGW
jgi:hypothetical protein